MDGITCGALATELNATLDNATVERIVMPDRNTVILQLYVPGEGKTNLHLSANPSYPYFQLHTTLPTPLLNPPPSFAMLLRKHLRRSRLHEVSAPPGERMLSFRFHSLNEMGDFYDVTLHFECMPRTANLVLVNHEDVILDAIRHIDHSVNRERETLPAHPYIRPPSQQRLLAEERLHMPENTLLSDLKPGLSVSRAAMQAVAGFSPILGTEAAFRAFLDPDRPISSLNALEKLNLEESIRTLCRLVISGDVTPRVYHMEKKSQGDDAPVAAHVLPLTHLHHYTSYKTIAEAVTAFNRRKLRDDCFKRKRTSLASRLRDEIRHARKKQLLHEEDAEKGAKADDQQLMGELILANIYQIPKGVDSVTLDNYHEDPPEKIVVKLNPQYTPADNAQAYFHQARRGRRKKEAAAKLLKDDERTLSWLTSLQDAIYWAENDEDLEAIASEYRTRKEPQDRQEKPRSPSHSSDTLPGQPGRRSKRREKAYANRRQSQGSKSQRSGGPAPIPPRSFTSSDGFTILVGRNPLQNDSLLRKARKDDVWMHIKNGAGSHVIVSSEGHAIPERTLNEAAGIAAWYSSANRAGGAKTDIDVCLVRDVKKPPRSAPGYVIYKNQKTILIEPLNPATLSTSVQT
ncbi:MAG: fibronectin/fibrinogen-binding protein [Clostridiaceae bacterium]|jgi:predicted ribosome quality control (RQC) complex YloA/Tae2 family protein|nr:fibronectin/fibrinogen-binding protein [Clostridiaceae bacterium]